MKAGAIGCADRAFRATPRAPRSRPSGLQSLVRLQGEASAPPAVAALGAGAVAGYPRRAMLGAPWQTADAHRASALQPPCGGLAALDGRCRPRAGSGALAARASVSSGSPLPALYPVRQPSPFHDCSQVARLCKVLSRHKAARVVPVGPTLYLFHDTLHNRATWLL